MYNVWKTRKTAPPCGDDPWDGRTLEWTTPSPPPHYNFAEVPIVHSRDDFWHHKYTEDDAGRLVKIPSGGSDDDQATDGGAVATAPSRDGGGDGDDGAHGGGDDHGHGGHGHGIHMPSPSYMPALASLAFPLIGFGAIYGWWIGAIGGVILAAGIFGWASEPGTEDEH